jgi:hypothetical protein
VRKGREPIPRSSGNQDNDVWITKEPGLAEILTSYRVKPPFEGANIDQLVKSCEKEGNYDDD